MSSLDDLISRGTCSIIENRKSSPAEINEMNSKLNIGSELTAALWSMRFIEII